MNKFSDNLLPWEVRTRKGQDDIDLTEIEALLDDFREVDVFAFLGVPDHSRESYMEESLDMLIGLDRARKVFAPEDYRDFLEEELRGLKVLYHSPDSRREEFQSIAEATGEIDSIIAPTMDYTVPRNYFEASRAFENVQTPEDNILVDFEEFRQNDGSLLSYIMTDINCVRGKDEEKGLDYSVNDTDMILPGVSYSESTGDYFGLNFFRPGSEASRMILPQQMKDIGKKVLKPGY